MIISLFITLMGVILILLGIVMMFFLEVNRPLGIILIAVGLLVLIRGTRQNGRKS